MIELKDFDPRLTLIDSAQVFHWKEENGVYTAVTGGHLVKVEGDKASGADEGFLREYFDCARDYEALKARFDELPTVKRALLRLTGLRVLNQPAWETVVMAILTANNNTARIRSLVLKINAYCGERVDGVPGFPMPETLMQVKEEQLRALGVGYRAPYLVKTARAVAEGFPLNDLRDIPYEKAHAMLKTLSGVGDKVADCILLFGCRHACAYPVDVWVKRLSQEWLGIEEKSLPKMREKARALLGEEAGIVQQYLFHCKRLGLLE